MIAALDLLASLPGRRVAILGEMLELGAESTAGHRAVGEYAGRRVDVLVAVGPMADDYAAAAGGRRAEVIAQPSRAALEEALAGVLRPGDVVLIKGSRGAALDELLPLLESAAQGVLA